MAHRFYTTTAAALAVAGLVFSGDWDRMKSIVPRGYVCYRASAPLRIDGKLDEAAWRAAPWSDPFADIEGSAKSLPRFATRMKMLWDDTYLYVAAEMEEPHVWGTLTEHDSVIFRDNDFEVFIDPDGDNHEYYEFEINALNTGWDLFLPRPYKDGGRAQNSWEIPELRTAVSVNGTLNDPSDTDRGWSVEIAFPWQAFAEFAHRAAPPRDGDQWRVNFSRVEWRVDTTAGRYVKVAGLREDNWVWSPQGIIDMHRPERWGYVQFSKRKPGAAAFRPDPALRARDLLMEIYHAQRTFRAAHGRWAETIEELGMASPAAAGLVPTLAPSETGFRASVEIRVGRRVERWHVAQDSRLWREP